MLEAGLKNKIKGRGEGRGEERKAEERRETNVKFYPLGKATTSTRDRNRNEMYK